MENTPGLLTEEELLKSLPEGKPVLIDFYADWCEPCKYLDEILTELETKLGDSALIMKLDVDQQTLLARHYHIMSVPTLMIFKNGEMLWRMAGFKLVHELEQDIRKFI